MKLILKYICYTLIVVFIIGLIMSLHTRKSVLVNYLIPPADFYSPLSTSGVQFDKHGIIFETNFLNKYPGKHALVVYTDKAIKMEDSFSVNIENVVQVRLDGNIILEKQGRTYKSWMENYNGETGFFLFKYSVPDHLPLRKKLHLQIILEKKNKEIEKRYGPLKIVLIKLSDE